MILHIATNNLEGTLALGYALGAACGGHEVIALTSDVGGGKTAFTKGLAAGMGATDTVQSPTFTISRVYRCRDGLELHHFDFYRLSDPGIMAAELAESLADDKVVVVIEWSDIVENILPSHIIRIAISVTGDTMRQFTITLSDEAQKLATALHDFKEKAS